MYDVAIINVFRNLLQKRPPMRQPFLKPQQAKPPIQRQVLTVSQLNKKAKNLIEAELGAIWIEGEISNFVRASSGHWYFTLKDNNAQIKCAIFKFKNRQVSFTPQEGDKIIVKGNVSLYEARGDYQLIADYMEPAGLGKLQQELNVLIEKLRIEGLLDSERKIALPFLPKSIGVITSASGAAVHDVLTVLKRRCPMVPVIIYPTQVQGESAVTSIIRSLNLAISREECDVILITRGGGSLEDLWCFNNEQLAREIADADIPIVAAIGHEVDITLTELVSDLRAATPSAAAELLVPDQQSLWQKVDIAARDIGSLLQLKINQLQVRLNIALLKLKDPEQQILQSIHRLLMMQNKLRISFNRQLSNKQSRLEALAIRLTKHHPRERLLLQQNQLNLLDARLNTSARRLLDAQQNSIKMLAGELNALSPLSTLGRGYSITRINSNKMVISKTSQTNKGQVVDILLSDGEIKCEVL